MFRQIVNLVRFGRALANHLETFTGSHPRGSCENKFPTISEKAAKRNMLDNIRRPQFDFIIVGGGTSGCLLANRLSSTKSKPSVLLIEAGGDASDVTQRNPYQRYLNAFIYPELDHGYSTTPQTGLGGRILPYARGKGLGGSTAVNFMIYTAGAAVEYDHWANLVGDKDWAWDATKERLKAIENFHGDVPAKMQDYARPKASDHGFEGPVDISLPNEWEFETKVVLDAAVELNYPINSDVNSGNPLGFGIAATSSYKGLRTTSASANILGKKLPNLTVWTNLRVKQVIFEGKRVIGVETIGGRKAFAAKEVILTAGAIDTPKILLLSGIGPAHELSDPAIGITPIHDLPGVGKNLQDHCGVFLSDLMDPKFSPKASFSFNDDEVALAKEQWLKDYTGPLTHHYGSVVISFVKDSSLADTDAFKGLDDPTQEYLRGPDVPSFELLFNGPLIPPTYPLTAKDGFMCSVAVLMNPQSRGEITLVSGNAEDPPAIDFGFMKSEYDRIAMIESIRQAMQFPKTSQIAQYWRNSIHGPKSESSDDIWAFISAFLQPLWHANGSVMMGKAGNKLACVDTDLNVFGLQGLRVADVSVCPITPSAHTQSTAYLIGQAAAEKIIHYYGLD